MAYENYQEVTPKCPVFITHINSLGSLLFYVRCHLETSSWIDAYNDDSAVPDEYARVSTYLLSFGSLVGTLYNQPYIHANYQPPWDSPRAHMTSITSIQFHQPRCQEYL